MTKFRVAWTAAELLPEGERGADHCYTSHDMARGDADRMAATLRQTGARDVTVLASD